MFSLSTVLHKPGACWRFTVSYCIALNLNFQFPPIPGVERGWCSQGHWSLWALSLSVSLAHTSAAQMGPQLRIRLPKVSFTPAEYNFQMLAGREPPTQLFITWLFITWVFITRLSITFLTYPCPSHAQLQLPSNRAAPPPSPWEPLCPPHLCPSGAHHLATALTKFLFQTRGFPSKRNFGGSYLRW